MSYLSQRYDLDAAAARKRNQSYSLNHDYRNRDQPHSSRTYNYYPRRPSESRSSSNPRRPERYHPRRNENPRSLRDEYSRQQKEEYTRPQREEYSRSRREDNDRYSHTRRASQATRNSSTYGTYILPLKTQGEYRTMDPTKCTCKCCPHPTSVTHCHDNQRRNPDISSSNGSRPVHNRRNSEGRYVIDVVDKSKGSLRREHGHTYPISLNPRASCDHVASFLAPDKRHARVVVHWDNGKTEKLDKQIPMGELIRHAEYLEVKEVKRVHWA
ncbi:hypothetical protein NW762_012509 [Fusarium torreyae]|uniref:Uncharacterized protein n=1 Tax=Fusarium torreyae TaxID=1237075 RepID=A0A9W8V8I1_9HYPO|nr:hypothetical protein NW762_012509 [Fusarium torreyae]